MGPMTCSMWDGRGAIGVLVCSHTCRIQLLPKFICDGSRWLTVLRTSVKHIPHIFGWRQVWWSRPGVKVDVLQLQECTCSCIVLLRNVAQKGNVYGSQNVIHLWIFIRHINGTVQFAWMQSLHFRCHCLLLTKIRPSFWKNCNLYSLVNTIWCHSCSQRPNNYGTASILKTHLYNWSDLFAYIWIHVYRQRISAPIWCRKLRVMDLFRWNVRAHRSPL